MDLRHPSPGRLEVIAGCMYAGKTERLIWHLNRARIARFKVQVFKPLIDDRYATDAIVTHTGERISSVPVQYSSDIPGLLAPDTQVLGIDEAQFFDAGLVGLVEQWASEGKRVIVAGLDLDYRAEVFGSMPALLAKADRVEKLTAICHTCGAPATRTQRISGGSESIVVGSAGVYEARCRDHYRNPLEACDD